MLLKIIIGLSDNIKIKIYWSLWGNSQAIKQYIKQSEAIIRHHNVYVYYVLLIWICKVTSNWSC